MECVGSNSSSSPLIGNWIFLTGGRYVYFNTSQRKSFWNDDSLIMAFMKIDEIPLYDVFEVVRALISAMSRLFVAASTR